MRACVRVCVCACVCWLLVVACSAGVERGGGTVKNGKQAK